jgi:hypothetical protein
MVRQLRNQPYSENQEHNGHIQNLNLAKNILSHYRQMTTIYVDQS